MQTTLAIEGTDKNAALKTEVKIQKYQQQHVGFLKYSYSKMAFVSVTLLYYWTLTAEILICRQHFTVVKVELV